MGESEQKVNFKFNFININTFVWSKWCFIYFKIFKKASTQIPDDNMTIINLHLRNGRNNEFPKKQFIVEGVEKFYCSYLFFTQSETNIEKKTDKIVYTCLLCQARISSVASDSRNIKRHLENDCKHSHMLAAWFKSEFKLTYFILSYYTYIRVFERL